MVHTVDVEKPAPPKRQVGDAIWAVPYTGEPHEVSVSKVGRRWLYVSFEGYDYPLDKETLRINWDRPLTPFANFFESAEAAAAAAEREAVQNAWAAFRNSLPWVAPIGVTLARIEDARRLLDGGEDAP
jgi:hypothetical protein